MESFPRTKKKRRRQPYIKRRLLRAMWIGMVLWSMVRPMCEVSNRKTKVSVRHPRLTLESACLSADKPVRRYRDVKMTRLIKFPDISYFVYQRIVLLFPLASGNGVLREWFLVTKTANLPSTRFFTFITRRNFCRHKMKDFIEPHGIP